jgi:hypothetical protein
MSRVDQLEITKCILDLDCVTENPAEANLDRLNARVSQVLGVELRDYVRSVDSALTLIPNGWSAEISWEHTPQEALVVLFAPDSESPDSMQRLVSYALRDGAKVHFSLPVAICLTALKVHLLIQKRKSRAPSISP